MHGSFVPGLTRYGRVGSDSVQGVPRISGTPKAASVRRLQSLLRRTLECEARCETLRDQRARAVLDVLEDEDVSRRVLADALGVSSSAVQHWANRGRQLRETSP